jgi:hypothetical protein
MGIAFSGSSKLLRRSQSVIATDWFLLHLGPESFVHGLLGKIPQFRKPAMPSRQPPQRSIS